MSFRVLLTSNVNDYSVESIIPFLVENLSNVRGFKGCLNVTVLFDRENKKMVFDEEWLTKEDHQNYIQYIQNNGVLGMLAEYLQGPPDIAYYERLEI